MKNAKKFFEEIIKTDEAKEIFASFKKPENEEEAVRIYSEISAKLGIELSEEEIKAYFDEKTLPERLMTKNFPSFPAAAKMTIARTPSVMKKIAGGKTDAILSSTLIKDICV